MDFESFGEWAGSGVINRILHLALFLSGCVPAPYYLLCGIRKNVGTKRVHITSALAHENLGIRSQEKSNEQTKSVTHGFRTKYSPCFRVVHTLSLVP